MEMSCEHPDADDPGHEAVAAILAEWLAEPEVTLVCGRWGNGAIMEVIPRGAAILTPRRYDGRFAGLRDVRLAGQEHHLHVDLARMTRVTYAVEPSVCFGFRPSFEVRFARADTPDAEPALTIALRSPYRGRELDADAVERFFVRMIRHCDVHPGRVVPATLSPDADVPRDGAWAEIEGCLERAVSLAGGARDGI